MGFIYSGNIKVKKKNEGQAAFYLLLKVMPLNTPQCESNKLQTNQIVNKLTEVKGVNMY